MSNPTVLEGWQLALLILACLIVFIALVIISVTLWAKHSYFKMLRSDRSNCKIDDFVNNAMESNKVSFTKVVMGTKLTLGGRKPNTTTPIDLEVFDSPHVPGLKVTRKLNSTTDDSDATPLKDLLNEKKNKTKPPIVVATIRMGFGHHRLAYSTCSWALQKYKDRVTIFHDLINIQPTEEADLIKNTDSLYSKFSRWASEIGGPVERLWGSAMLSGDADALRMAAFTAVHLQPLLLAFPKDTILITSHQLVALTASVIGFTNVINLVVDNHPQWFLTVPNTLNVVQGPVNYQSFLKMGVVDETDKQELEWLGHWCPAQMVDNIDADCQRRIRRHENRIKISSGGDMKPLRLLIPVGGAGAQRKFIIAFVKAVASQVKEGKIQLFLNAGDHVHMKTAFLQVLDECGVDFETIDSTNGVVNFQERLLKNENNEPTKAVTLFAFDEYFPAVATTDILCRVTDVLCCKPSELAFYCVPKLHIRRVGDHEADSAKRASELNDGTIEAREISDSMQFLSLFLKTPLLKKMNTAIMNNNKIGLYDGCKNAVEMAVERSKSK